MTQSQPFGEPPSTTQDLNSVLIVDDVEFFRLRLREILEKEQLTILEATSGAQALALFEAHRPPIILLDLVMKGMDGIEICKRIKQLPGGEQTTILMLTNLDQEKAINAAFEVGATDYFTKPFNEHILAQRLRYIFHAKNAERERRHAARALEQSEERLRLFADASTESMHILDRALNIQFINRIALETLKEAVPAIQTGADVIGKNLFNIYPFLDDFGFGAKFSNVIETGEPLVDFATVYHPVRGDLQVEIRAFKVGDGLGILVDDITDQERAQEAYRTLVEKSLQGLIILQLGRVVFANPHIAEISGYTIEELLAFSAGEITAVVHPDDRERIMQQLTERLEGKPVPNRSEFRFVRKDGTIRWVETFATAINFAGKPAIQVAYIDITDRKHAQAALQEHEEYLTLLTDNLPNVVFTVRMPERKIEYVNATMTEVFGYAPEAVVGQTTRLFYENDDEFASFGTQLQAALRSGQPHLQIEQKLRRENGEIFWSSIHTTFIFSGDELSQVISVVTDITGLKEAEQVRLENEGLTVALQKEQEHLELQRRFMTTISHELRTPLTAINMSSATLKNFWEKLDEPKRQENLERIIKQVYHLEGLLGEFSLQMRLEHGRFPNHPAQIDPEEICTGVLNKIEALALDTHQIKFERKTETDEIHCDPLLLEHILENLVTNAIKYSPDGGRVTVTLSQSNKHVTFHVSDEGIGISEADQARLFTPYFRGENVGAIRGTGMGLAIVQDMVDLCGGKVACTSTPGSGSTFIITIPISHKSP